MTTAATGAAIQPKPRRKTYRWLMWIGIVALAVLVAIGVGIVMLMHRAEPMLRAALIDTLQKRFHARVELDNLHASAVNGFDVQATGLRIWLPPEAVNSLPADPSTDTSWRSKPWIVVNDIRFHANWNMRPGDPILVSVIHVQGAKVMLPPKAARPHFSFSGKPGSGETGSGDSGSGGSAPENSKPPAPQTVSKPGLFQIPDVVIQRVECENALLSIARTQQPGKPEKLPLDFQFNNVVVLPDGKGGPMAFSVDMVNAKPVGKIHSTGHVGPWNSADPGSLPVQGDYTFSDADLGTIKGIDGILSSTGHYEGSLRKIEAEGETQTPDFRLERESGAPGEMLATHFRATIDGTNGDTWLDPVDAMLGQTHIVAKGKVVRAEDDNGVKRGHDITLDVTVDRGRIEDILAITTDKVFLTGALTLHTSFHLPPGDQQVLDKLELNGQFHLSQSRFTNASLQSRIADLSLRGQGKPDEIKTTDPDTILSDMQGHFKLGGGQIQLPDLNYRVPGADIAVHGAYGMKGGTLDFDGDAKLDASLSRIVGGWKGLLLTPADKFLQKNGAGTDVPIHVKGTRKDPKFGVDFNRLGKNDEPQTAGGEAK